MNRLRRPLALTLLATTLQLAGCFRYREVPIVDPPAPDSVEVRQGGTDYTLHHVQLDGDYISGWIRYENGDSTRMRIRNERREIAGFSVAKTLLWVGAVVLVFAVAVSQSDWTYGR